jgi:pimeloyl-ACP methyl ester carboxylesterase
MRRSAFGRSGLRKAIADERALTSDFVARAQASSASFVSLMREVALGPPPATDRPTCPVIAIWGEKDGLFPLPQGRAIAASVGAELVVLPGIAHMPQREAPEETAARVASFVDGLPH